MVLTRRRFLLLLPAPLAALLAAACGGDEAPATDEAAGDAPAPGSTAASTPSPSPAGAASARLEPTPYCGDNDDPTPSQTEGPYFTPNSPQRASLLEPGLQGTRLLVEGFVLTRGCQPVARALIDFWQCDDRGAYDNSGYRLRGHQFTDANGRYRLGTIVPGIYPGRTRHIHVKVQAPNQRVLTTQLYFPGEPGNARDSIYNRVLELRDYRDAAGGKAGSFDFVLNLA